MNTRIENNIATWKEYLSAFEYILNSENPPAPYSTPAYLDYVKLNYSRQKRWLKTGVLTQDIIAEVKKIDSAQTWYIITEPWCGDAAHSIPFLKLISEHNPLITLKIVWRDTPPFLIDSYLTQGGKSVPKLIVRDTEDNDLYTWGPRPEPCQKIYLEMKKRNVPSEANKVAQQNWYNTDKGQLIQTELLALIREMNLS